VFTLYIMAYAEGIVTLDYKQEIRYRCPRQRS